MTSSFKDNNEGSNMNLNPKPRTTFIEADPSNFRAVVQLLTGAKNLQQPSTSTNKLTEKPTISKVGQRRSRNKLHERRKSGRKLKITLARPVTREENLIGSPVSTLDGCGRRSPGTPMEEEDRAIAEKGFYLHPSPIGGSKPELLVLFPLNLPKNNPSYSS